MRFDQYYSLGKRYRIVMWDLVTRDYSKWLTPQGVLNNVRRYARNGSIITFHDSVKSIDKLHFALPESIKWLKKQGYAFKVFDSQDANCSIFTERNSSAGSTPHPTQHL